MWSSSLCMRRTTSRRIKKERVGGCQSWYFAVFKLKGQSRLIYPPNTFTCYVTSCNTLHQMVNSDKISKMFCPKVCIISTVTFHISNCNSWIINKDQQDDSQKVRLTENISVVKYYILQESTVEISNCFLLKKDEIVLEGWQCSVNCECNDEPLCD